MRRWRGSYPCPHLGLGWSEEAARRWLAVVSGGVCGGNAGRSGRRRAVVAWDVELKGDVKGRFIGQGMDEEDGVQRPVGELQSGH